MQIYINTNVLVYISIYKNYNGNRKRKDFPETIWRSLILWEAIEECRDIIADERDYVEQTWCSIWIGKTCGNGKRARWKIGKSALKSLGIINFPFQLQVENDGSLDNWWNGDDNLSSHSIRRWLSLRRT